MLSLYEMTTKGDADNRQMADLLLRNVFYERETLDLLVELLKSYQVRVCVCVSIFLFVIFCAFHGCF